MKLNLKLTSCESDKDRLTKHSTDLKDSRPPLNSNQQLSNAMLKQLVEAITQNTVQRARKANMLPEFLRKTPQKIFTFPQNGFSKVNN